MTAAGVWPCLDEARRGEDEPRCPLIVDGRLAGSVSAEGRQALAAWPELFRLLSNGSVELLAAPGQRDAALATVHAVLRKQGLIRAWRDEPFALWNDAGERVAVIERAASRFWGALTLGAHANGYVASAGDGRPTHLWIARRAWDKPTDPGRLDNMIGAGVPLGQSPLDALRREAWEEAGLRDDDTSALRRGRVIELRCSIPEGWQQEWLYVFDLELPPGLVPRNQDGEVAEHRLMSVSQALSLAATGEMTTDASLATLDFALRHGLLAGYATAAELASRFERLLVPDSLSARFDVQQI